MSKGGSDGSKDGNGNMRRFYLSPSGQKRVPALAENGHFGMAKTELGPLWKGDAEDAYAEMWKRGWVRVVEYTDRIFAERYIDGKPVSWAELTLLQQQWLENKKLSGKSVFWNSNLVK